MKSELVNGVREREREGEEEGHRERERKKERFDADRKFSPATWLTDAFGDKSWRYLYAQGAATHALVSILKF